MYRKSKSRTIQLIPLILSNIVFVFSVTLCLCGYSLAEPPKPAPIEPPLNPVTPRPQPVTMDWAQWRGPGRNGVADHSPRLLDRLPDGGLAPTWQSESLLSAFDGGWGCPVVAGGRVYLFVHNRGLRPGIVLPPQKFPWKPQGDTPDAQYADYEVHRRDEEEVRAKNYAFYETLWCFDASTGKTIWKQSYESVYTRFMQCGTVAVHAGRVYALGAGRVARAFDAVTGKQAWETRIPGQFRDEMFSSSFAIADGVAAVLCGHFVGLDANSGSLLWQGDTRSTRGTDSSPTVWSHGGKEYFIVNVNRNETIAVEPRSGRELWREQTFADNSTPVIVGDAMVTLGGSRKGGVRRYDLSPEKPTLRWHYTQLADQGSSPVIVGAHVYAQGGNTLACLSLEDGSVAWQAQLDREQPRFTSLIAADGKVLYTYGGFLSFAADPAGYKPLADGRFLTNGILATRPGTTGAPLDHASPALADGRLFIRPSRSRASPTAAVRP